MLYMGAKDRTARELEDAMGLRTLNITKQQLGQQFRQVLDEIIETNSSDIEFISANRLVTQTRNPILTQYSHQLKDDFNSTLQTVDFLFKSEDAVKEINAWITTATRGKVDNVLDTPLSPLSVLVLLNAVYFKGQWREQFLKWATKEEDFHGLNKAVKVPLMKLSHAFNYTTVPQLNAQLIELPYGASDGVSMYVLLPNDSSITSSMRDKLTLSLFVEAIDNMTVTTVRTVLPKFTINAKYELKNCLQALGIRQAFTYKSDLSGIDGTNYLHISGAYHKAIVEVDETGSAVHSAQVGAKSRGLFGRYRNVPTFRADHPFLFIIKHKSTGIILFMGIVNKP